MVDSAALFKPFMVLSLILGIIQYVTILAFPPVILLYIAYGFIIRSLNDEGTLAKYAPVVVFGDIYVVLVTGLGKEFPFLFLTVGILFALTVLMWSVIRREQQIFGRTVQSMRMKDRQLARKALSTGKPEDIIAVAQYTDWNSF